MHASVKHTPGIVTISNANTTIAYCRYTEGGEVEYIFVNSGHRRQGYAKQLLALVESRVQCRLRFQAPISLLGAKLQSCKATMSHGQMRCCQLLVRSALISTLKII
jgi:hypothetical protein